MLMAASFFPALTSLLSLIPTPVLGAVLLYSGCYIMSGGFSALSECVMDDRRIFTIFLSIFFAVSTLIPNLYAFLPESVSTILVSPMVMGVCVLLVTTLLSRIGTKKVFSFVTGTGPLDIIALNEEIEKVCRQRGTERALMRKIQISLNSLCESLCEITPDAQMECIITYDPQQIRLHLESKNVALPDHFEPADAGTFGITMMILNNMFETVKVRTENGTLRLDLLADL